MRKFDEINQEYANICVRIGDIYTKKMAMQTQLDLLIDKAKELEMEATEAQLRESKSEDTED